MINLSFAENKTYYLVGMGKSNHGAYKALKKAGADLRIWDDNSDNLSPYDAALIRSPEKAPWSKIKAVVIAPGIPPTHEVVTIANDKNIPIICDVDLYAQSQPQSKVIGITGTNGKSTVTALLCHVLNFDEKAQMGGNIGTAVLELKSRMDYTVLELSSYQLDRSPHLMCDIAILLNITPDHLEWHGDMDHYIASKAKIFNNAKTKIISVNDEYCTDIYNSYKDHAIALDVFAEELPIQAQDFPRLKGIHNLQNILAVYDACRALNIDHDIIVQRIKSFDGLAHRQQIVRLINGVPYINDSKATNASSTKMALLAYPNILWIAGGLEKDNGLEGVEETLQHVTKAFLFGHAQNEFAKFLSARGTDVETYDTLDCALNAAHSLAQDMRGDPQGAPCVLFSPACSSFDQYKNFEDRGNHFVQLTEALNGE